MSIQKPDAGWWRGDYGGLKCHWFPANFTRLEDSPDSLDTSDSLESPDNLQRGQYSVYELVSLVLKQYKTKHLSLFI